MYKLTMIIPVFNADDCLDQAITSLFNQTIGFENIEVLIVDDCSTDGTKELIKYYEENYVNCKGIFLEENTGGAGIPRNIGVRNATSKYVMFLDADDEYEKDACEVYYNNITSSDADFAFSHWTFVTGDNLSKTSHPFLKQTKVYVFEDGENIRNYQKYYRPAMYAGIYNRDFIIKNDIHCTAELGEDSYFMLDALFNAKKIVFIDYYGYYNKLRDSEEKQSITNLRDEKRFNSRVKSIYYFDELLKEYDCEDNVLVISDEIRVLIYQVYTLMPQIPNDVRRRFFEEIYELEVKFGIKKFDILHFNTLNYFIINKHFKCAVLISNIIGRLYNNQFTRKVLRKVSLLISKDY